MIDELVERLDRRLHAHREKQRRARQRRRACVAAPL
jgi:ribosome-associated translation inhibitor RaiA